jgi:hypothetical protein
MDVGARCEGGGVLKGEPNKGLRDKVNVRPELACQCGQRPLTGVPLKLMCAKSRVAMARGSRANSGSTEGMSCWRRHSSSTRPRRSRTWRPAAARSVAPAAATSSGCCAVDPAVTIDSALAPACIGKGVSPPARSVASTTLRSSCCVLERLLRSASASPSRKLSRSAATVSVSPLFGLNMRGMARACAAAVGCTRLKRLARPGYPHDRWLLEVAPSSSRSGSHRACTERDPCRAKLPAVGALVSV